MVIVRRLLWVEDRLLEGGEGAVGVGGWDSVGWYDVVGVIANV